MDYKNSFVLYESVYAQYDRLMRRGKVQAAQDFIDAVMRYGLYSDEPDEDSEVWDFGFDGVIATISSAKDRYTKRVDVPKVQAAQDFIDAVMRYGLYSDEPDEDSEVWDFGFDGVIATISSAKDRYTKRVDVPKEELEKFVCEGRTQQEIASYYNCSIDTIQRRMKTYGIARRKTAENTAKPQEPHRAADLPQKSRKQFNENDNDNGKENEKEKENGKAKSRPTVGF